MQTALAVALHDQWIEISNMLLNIGDNIPGRGLTYLVVVDVLGLVPIRIVSANVLVVFGSGRT